MFTAWAVRRLTRAVGLGAEAQASIAGGQLDRILAGEDLADVGRAPGTDVLGPRNPRTERALAYLTAAAIAVFRRFDPTEALQLACAACLTTEDGEEAELLGAVAELTQLALDAHRGPRAGTLADHADAGRADARRDARGGRRAAARLSRRRRPARGVP